MAWHETSASMAIKHWHVKLTPFFPFHARASREQVVYSEQSLDDSFLKKIVISTPLTAGRIAGHRYRISSDHVFTCPLQYAAFQCVTRATFSHAAVPAQTQTPTPPRTRWGVRLANSHAAPRARERRGSVATSPPERRVRAVRPAWAARSGRTATLGVRAADFTSLLPSSSGARDRDRVRAPHFFLSSFFMLRFTPTIHQSCLTGTFTW